MAVQAAGLVEERRINAVESAFEKITANPFWHYRYGEKADRAILKDLNFNIDYLVSALRLLNPGTLTYYYRWQRDLLSPRGMCTRHLLETQAALHSSLTADLPELAIPLAPYVLASASGLAYDLPACRELHWQEDSTAEAAALCAVPQEAAESARLRANCAQHNRYFVSYLLDAVAASAPARLLTHLQWIAGFLEPLGIAPVSLQTILRCLRVEIEARLPAHAAPFIEVLNRADL
jgi:hypothetical protein